ncbi:DICT sensory domain-containing protein [Chloroflexus aggregans]|uniref:Anti-sigma-factor antagonist n=1 Tax=Chloroflexus aggregans (strain MD-66 / DSM 9485) TaxID=326427 RepID=B8GA31_CHLAD|nr:DICT sensory domain-containing protein [Chloroflexus aggregans]ACL24546.1 anti-sigma-factor antagonist [Chloroflexus aggregans DSM 9485]
MGTLPRVPSLFHLMREKLAPDVIPFMATKATLVDLSHTLEDCILHNRLPSVIFTGFQESSHWRKETQRYLELANIASAVCIFAGGLPAFPDEQHIAVTLEAGDPLRQEWFLLVLTEWFCALLCGLDQQLPAEREAERRFETLLTFQPEAITQALAVLIPVVERYRPDRAAELVQAHTRFPPRPPSGPYITQIVSEIVSHLQRRYDQEHRLVMEIQALSAQQQVLETMIADLGAPVIPLLEGVILMPIIGNVDSRRAQLIMEHLLTGIAERMSDVAIIDITGMPIVDTAVANYLLQTIRATRLLGAQVIITGIRPSVAQAMINLGIDFSQIITRSTLREGIEAALGVLGYEIRRKGTAD